MSTPHSEYGQNVPKVSIFFASTIVICYCLKSLGHGLHTGCYWNPLPLLRDDFTEQVDVRHLLLFSLPLEDALQVLKWVQVEDHPWPLHYLHLQLPQEGSCHLGGVWRLLSCWKTVMWPSF